MTRFTFKGDVTWGSGGNARSFPVMAENQAGFDRWAGKVGNAFNDGVSLLENTLAALNRPKIGSEVVKYANRYFLTGKTLDKSDIDKIKIVFNKTLLGLRSGTMGVKVLDNDPDAYGFVNGDANKPSHKSYHNTAFMVDTGQDERNGAIHIDGEALGGGRLGAETMIHEATHKYAGTEDYCYFKNDAKTPDGVFTDKARALQNADSYGWFAVKIGRKSGKFKSKMYS